MSNQFLKLRRSAVPGKIPDTGSLALGEIALNTYDGRAFMKKDGANGEEVVVIGSPSGSFSGSFSGEFTGSLLGTASWAVNAVTASTADNFFVRGNITGSNALFTGTVTAQTLVVQTITSSVIYSSGSNIFGNKLTDTQQFTGSVTITGSLELNGDPVVTETPYNNFSSSIQSRVVVLENASASFAEDSGSNSARLNNLELSASVLTSASASFAEDSGSNSLRLTDLESTASVLTTASASFAIVSSSYANASESFSSRVTNLESTASVLTTASESFALVSASYSAFSQSFNTGSFTGSFTGTGFLTGSFSGSFSGNVDNINGITNFIAKFDSPNSVDSSVIYQSASHIAINETNFTEDNPEALYVFQTHPTSINVLTGKGNLNNYLQNNIQNTNQGVNASSDVVATANNGNETSNYVDMGINSENYNQNFIGGPNDAYLYSIANNLHIGNANDNGTHVALFVGGTDVDANTKLQLNPDNRHFMSGSLDLTGSLNVKEGITGSLYGTSSWAISASFSQIASVAILAPGYTTTASFNQFTSSYYTDSASFSGSISLLSQSLFRTSASYASASGSLSTRVTDLESTASVLTTASASFAIVSSSFASTSESLSTRVTDLESTASVLTTASASFAIVSSSFASTSESLSTRVTDLESTASILTTASASFAVVSASYADASQSLSTRVITLENASSSFAADSGSNSIRLTNLESTASVLTTASASFALVSQSYSAFSQSYNTGSFTGSFVGQGYLTGSLFGTSSWANNAVTASHVLNAVSASYAATASSADNFLIRQDATASNLLVTNTITAQTLVVQTITSSVDFVTGSTRFGTQLTDTHQFTGSVTITGSLSLNNSPVVTNSTFTPFSSSIASRATQLEATASVLTSASASFAQQSGSNSTRLTNLESTASVLTTASASFAIVSASYASTSESLSNRVNNLESTASVLTTASASFAIVSSSYASASSSLSTRTTNLESTASILTTASASFALVSASYSAFSQSYNTGSFTGSFIGTGNLTGSLFGTASWAVNAISASHAPSSATASFATTASFAQTASVALSGNGLFSGSFSGSFFGNGAGLTNISASSVVGLNLSLISSGSVTASTDPAYGFRVNSNTQISGSTRITGSLGVTGSFSLSGSVGSIFSANVDTLVFSGSILQTGSIQLTGSLNVTSGGITSSLFGTSSWAVSASHAPTSLTASFAISSSLSQTASLAILAPAYTTTASFTQFTSSYYADSSSFSGSISLLSQSFLQTSSSYASASGSLSRRVTNLESTSSVLTTASASFALVSQSYSAFSQSYNTGSFTGSFTGVGNLTGSLFGTSSWSLNAVTASHILNAISASYAATASSADNFVVRQDITASNALITNTITAQTLVVQTITSSVDFVTGSTRFGTQLTNTHQFTGSVSVTGSLSLNNSPVVTNATFTPFSSSVSTRLVTLENASASFASDSGSNSTRLTNLESTASVLTTASASFAQQSGSNSIRLTNLESTASVLTTASASFAIVSSSYASASSSLSTRTTNLESTASILTTASASFAIVSSSYSSASQSLSTRTTNLESTASILTTASASFAIVSSSYASASGSLSTRVTTLENASASFAQQSGSNSIRLTNLESTASILTTASASFALVSSSYSAFSQSYNTGSFTGSFTGRGNLTGSLFGTASWALNAITASNALTASFVLNAISASFASTASSVNPLVQNVLVTGSLLLSGSFTQTAGTGSFGGPVGIGTITPVHALDIRSGDLFITGSRNLRTSFIRPADLNETIYFQSSGGTTSGRMFMDTTTWRFKSSGAQDAINIFSNGRVGILQTSDAGFSFDVNGTTRLQNNTQITGSLTAPNITGSLFGTASWALNATTASFVLNTVSASFAATASSADNFVIRQNATASNLLVNNTITAQTLVVQTITSSVDFVTGSTRFGTQLTNTHQFTGSVTITGSLALNNDPVVTQTSYNAFSSSIQSRVTTLENASGSFSTRVTNLESTASVLTTASASFAIVSSSFATTSASLSTRTTNLESTASVLTTASASFAIVSSSYASASASLSTRVTNLESTASVLTTASASFAVVSSSFASASGSLSTRTTNLETTASVLTTASASFAIVSSSYAALSGSFRSGSYTGSFTGVGNLTGSLFGTASWALNAITASNALTASFVPTSSLTGNFFAQNGNSFGTQALLGTNDNQNLAFETSGSVRMFISSSGIVGINTTTPGNFNLDVNGTTRVQGQLTVSTDGASIIGNTIITGSLTVSSSNATQFLVGSNLLNVSGSGIVTLQSAAPEIRLIGTTTNTGTKGIYFYNNNRTAWVESVPTGGGNTGNLNLGAFGTTMVSLNGSGGSPSSVSIGYVTLAPEFTGNSVNSGTHYYSFNSSEKALRIASTRLGSFGRQNLKIMLRTAFSGTDAGDSDTFFFVPGTNRNISINSTTTDLGYALGVSGSFGVLGSAKIGNDVTNTHTITGSQSITGSFTLIGNQIITGSSTATAGYTGSLFGTASWAQNAVTASYVLQAVSASFAATASSADNFVIRQNATASNLLVNNTITAQTLVVQTITSSVDFVTGSTRFGTQLTNTHQFTGSVSVTGSLSVNNSPVVTEATFTPTSSSISLRVTNLESTASVLTSASASFAQQSGSNSIRLTNLESTASVLTTASASFALVSSSYSAFSQSYNTGSFTGSFTGVGNLTGSLFGTSSWAQNATTASFAFTASLTISSSLAANSILLNGTGSSVFATTGSNVFVGNQTVTGSLFTSGSNTLVGSTNLTGSLNISGSTIQVGNNTLLGNTTLSGSIIISGSLGSQPTIKIYGDTQHDGYIRFDPVTTNIDTSISASYIFVSGSTQDLYFSQNGKGYSNVTRLRWLEGNLYTGLLNGGLITSQSSTTYQVGSGSGIIVNLNASLNDNPYPTTTYVNWPNLTGNINQFSASYDQTFVAISSTGTLISQSTAFLNGQVDTQIPVGYVAHQDNSTINGTVTEPSLAYGWKQRSNVFISAFGPLKLSGFNLAVSGSSTGSLVVGNGTAFLDGGNYQTDPNNPSYVTGTGTNTSRIFRYYESGSDWVYDTNAGAGYGAIDPARYSNNGTLSSVGAGNWSIQRVFFFPTSPLSPKPIIVYYGNAIYATEADAIANIPFEPFTEAPSTAAAAIYLGAIVISGNGLFTSPATFTIYPGGLFRQVGGSGGGGSIVTQTLAGLSDVNISGPTNYQALVYDAAQLKWVNASFISASISGNAATATSASFATTASFVQNAISSSFATTASFVTTAQTASYVLQAVSSSFATTASFASTASFVSTASLVGNFFAQNGNSFGTQALLGTNDNQNLAFETSGSVRMFISSSGLVGINTTTPIAQLDVNGSVRITSNTVMSGSLTLVTPGNTAGFISPGTDGISIGNNGSGTHIRIRNSNRTALDQSVGFGGPGFGWSTSDRITVLTAGATAASSGIWIGSSANSNIFRVLGDNSVVLGNSIDTGVILQVSGSEAGVGLLNVNNRLKVVGSTTQVTGSLNVTGSSTIIGRLTANDITGSLFGTASWALNATTASFVLNAVSASFAATASSADNFLIRQNATASNLLVNNTITAQTLVVQTVTSSVDFVTGSTRFGTQLTNTHQFTGSVTITGSLSLNDSPVITNAIFTPVSTSVSTRLTNLESTASVLTTASASFALVSSSYSAFSQSYNTGSFTGSFTGTLIGTASWANNALTSSNVLGGLATYVPLWNTDTTLTSSYLNQASNTLKTIYNGTDRGLTLNYGVDSYILGNAGVGNSTYLQVFDGGSVINVYSPNYTYFNDKVGVRIIPTNPGLAVSGSLEVTGPGTTKFINTNAEITGALNVSSGITGSLFGTASWAQNAVTSSYILQAVSASFATTASYVLNAVSSSFASTASFVLQAVSSSFATSASFAQTASFVLNAVSASFASTASSVNTLVQPVIISGSLTIVTGSGIELQVTNTGVTIGNASTDRHNVTGSLNVSASLTVTGSISTNAGFFVSNNNMNFGPNGANSLSLGNSAGVISLSSTILSLGSNTTTQTNLYGSVNINSGSLSSALQVQANASVATGSFQTIASVATGSYRCAFFDYVAFSGSIARAGTVTSTWGSNIVEWFETYTNDVSGSTSAVTLQAALSGSNIQLQAGISGSAWTVRSLVRLL